MILSKLSFEGKEEVGKGKWIFTLMTFLFGSFPTIMLQIEDLEIPCEH